MAKLIVLIIDADSDPVYQIGRDLWRENAARHGIQVFFLKASPAVTDDTVYVDGDCLYTKWIDDLHPRINDKTLKAFQYCHEHCDFDYLLRTNLSSFYRLDALQAYLAGAPRQHFYAGPVQHLEIQMEEGGSYLLEYISGSGILLSRDLVPALLTRKTRIPQHHVDDIWIGVALLRIPRRPLHRCDFEDVDRVSVASMLKIRDRLAKADDRDDFHYRVKNTGGEMPRHMLDGLVFSMLVEKYLG